MIPDMELTAQDAPDQSGGFWVRAATTSAIVTLLDACISQDPRIEPDCIRTQPKTTAAAKTRGNILHTHVSVAIKRMPKCGRKNRSA